MDNRLLIILILFSSFNVICKKCPWEPKVCDVSIDGMQFKGLSSQKLYAATKSNNVVEMKNAVKDGRAMVDTRGGNNDNTPLMEASKNGSDDAVKYLLESGANARLKNRCGKTAQDLAKQYAAKPQQIIKDLKRNGG